MSIPPPRRFRPDEIQPRGAPAAPAGLSIPPRRPSRIAPDGQPSPTAPAPASSRAQGAIPPFRPASDIADPARGEPRPASPAEQVTAGSLAPLPGADTEPIPPPRGVAVAPPVARDEAPAPAPVEPSEPAKEPVKPDSKTEEALTLADLVAPDAETSIQISGVPQSPGPAGTGESGAMPAGLSHALHILGTPAGTGQAAAPLAAGPRVAQAESLPADVGQAAAAPAPEAKANPGRGEAQAVSSDQPSSGNPAVASAPSQDLQIERTGCATCGGFHSSLDGPLLHGCLTCGGGGPNCVPGQKPCNPPLNECNTTIGAFCQRLYECLCCPDPCYQPSWDPAANASFFADYARPRTVTRLRYDNLENMTRPDRNQFFINQVKLAPNKNLRIPSNQLYARLQQLYLYQEAAGERGSFFVEIPYRQINQSWAPSQSGFGDINFGVKSLLFDCEMLQLSFQLRTYMPSGNFVNNLGNGQFALDPSILTSLKLTPTTYFQGQFGNWIPLGGPSSATLTNAGNNKMAGGIFYWFMSLNQVLWYATPDSPLIATLEMDGWSFENGGYTREVFPGSNGQPNYRRPADGGGVSYFNIGPGLRQSVCNRLDFGGAITWATNTAHWAQPWFRFEVRFLF